MCGIFGCVGEHSPEMMKEDLLRLMYRGTDSSGLAYFSNGLLVIRKGVGDISDILSNYPLPSSDKSEASIGHTRWATHGGVTIDNSHPHTSNDGKIALVHNGTVRNYIELREDLIRKGYNFYSQTDTEVIPNLLQDLFDGDLLQTMLRVVGLLNGSFALAAISSYKPDTVIVAKKGNPLYIGFTEKNIFVSSDAPTLTRHTKLITPLEDEEIAELRPGNCSIFNFRGERIEREPQEVNFNGQDAEKGDYGYYYEKEVLEQGDRFGDLGSIPEELLAKATELIFETLTGSRVHVWGEGTSYHAGLYMAYLMQQIGVPLHAVNASEASDLSFVKPHDLIIGLSQSGETYDLSEPLKQAKRNDARVLTLTNVVGSTIYRLADVAIPTMSGPEIAVVSTKNFLNQLGVSLKLWIRLGQKLGYDMSLCENELDGLPGKIRETIDRHYPKTKMQTIAAALTSHEPLFALGRGLAYPIAQEIDLKFVETDFDTPIARIRSYPAGTMKHGPLARVGDETISIVVNPLKSPRYGSTCTNIENIKARGGKIVGILNDSDSGNYVNYGIYVPDCAYQMSGPLMVIPGQLLALYLCQSSPDRPRNLAKAVTVE